MRIAAALAFIASVLVMTPEAVSAMPLTLGDHAALSRHMSTPVMQVAHRHAYAPPLQALRLHRAAPLQLAVLSLLAALPLLLLAARTHPSIAATFGAIVQQMSNLKASLRA